MTEMMYEIKDEIVKEVREENEKIRKEMKIENEKLRADYDTRMSSLSGKFESVKFDNANLLNKMPCCGLALKRWKEKSKRLNRCL